MGYIDNVMRLMKRRSGRVLVTGESMCCISAGDAQGLLNEIRRLRGIIDELLAVPQWFGGWTSDSGDQYAFCRACGAEGGGSGPEDLPHADDCPWDNAQHARDWVVSDDAN